MPTYEYHCRNCDQKLEKMQKISDPVLTDCPNCGQPTLQKIISPTAFILKGSGWYKTDFKSEQSKNLHQEASESNVSSSETKSSNTEQPAAQASQATTTPPSTDTNKTN